MDRTRYDRVARILHWLTAVLVLANFDLAQSWEGVARPTHRLMVMTHMSFGVLLTLVVVARIVWRLMPGHRVASVVTGLTDLASKAVHGLLYLLLIAEAVLGFALRWSEGRAMTFFFLQIPSPMAAVPRAVNEQIGEIHEWVGWAIVIVAAGHAAAALYHHFIVKDEVLKRMLPERARRAA